MMPRSDFMYTGYGARGEDRARSHRLITAGEDVQGSRQAMMNSADFGNNNGLVLGSVLSDRPWRRECRMLIKPICPPDPRLVAVDIESRRVSHLHVRVGVNREASCGRLSS